MQGTLGIIAGQGRFPLHVLLEAKRQGYTVAVVGLQGWVNVDLASHADHYVALPVGKLGELIRFLSGLGVRQAVMAGKVTKQVLLEKKSYFDLKTLGLLATLKDRSVNGMLGGVADLLAKEGITLVDSSIFLKDFLCPAGALTRHKPSAEQEKDIQWGLHVARALASVDVGQTVIVHKGVVLALEALEGTDAAIRRAFELGGEGLVVVKMASPKQDRRFDLPCVGMTTLQTLKGVKAGCLALEAGSTLLLDRDQLIGEAEQAGIALYGVAVQQ